MIGYGRDFNETKYMSFLIKYDSLKKVKLDLEKISNSIRLHQTLSKGFDSEPVYNEKYLITKITSSEGKINRNFQNHKLPK